MNAEAPKNNDTPSASSPSQVASSPSQVDWVAGFWARLHRHKVLQWGLGYVGAALAIAHGQELMATAYGWPHSVGQFVMSLLVLGLPVTLVLAWYHGHRGLRNFSGAEMTIVAILLVIGAGLLILLVRAPEHGAAAAAVEQSSIQQHSEPAAGVATRAKPRVAILPLANLSPDPANAFFTDGMHEQILTALSDNAPGLEIISRTTMMTFRDKAVTARQLASELGATHVLEGSVRRDGDLVRVTLQLIDGATDNHVWSKDYDRTVKDSLSLQAEIAAAVADQLSVAVLQAAERAKPPTTSAEAYDLYLKANLAYQSLGTFMPPEPFRQADELLQRALALDPDFALAHRLRAEICRLLFASNNDVSEENVRLWRSELDAAARLAPEDPSVLASQGDYAYEIARSSSLALSFFEQVETKGLVNPFALVGKTYALLAQRRMDEAIATGMRIFQVDSRNIGVAVAPVTSYWVAHRTQDAWRIISTGPSKATPLPSAARWYFTGELDPTFPFLLPSGPLLSAAPLLAGPLDEQPLAVFFEFARYAGRVRDFKALLDGAPAESVRATQLEFIFTSPGAGREPLAELRGWASLLLGDEAGAASHSKPVLDFVAKQKETPWNAWFLRMLAADAALFAGDKPAAAAKAREAAELSPCAVDAVRCLAPQVQAAQVFAWAGAEDEAAALLEKLALEAPGIAPAHVARDPLFTIPLRTNARYQALKAKLDAQMAATTLQ